jgi:hypothetical protein
MATIPTPRPAPALLALACAPLLAHADQLAGTVRDAAGQAVAGALVVAASQTETRTADGRRRRWVATSDAAGRYAFDGFPPGLCRVTANAGPDRVGLATTPCRVEAADSAVTADIVVTRQPEHASGHVLLPYGAKPAAGDVVLLARYPSGQEFDVTDILGTPVVDGTWSLDLPAGTWMVRAITAAGDSRMGQFIVPGQNVPVELSFGVSHLKHPQMARELHAMVEKDQDARKASIAAGEADRKAWASVGRIDRANLARLRQLIRRNGWPTAADIGDDGMGDLWLLAQHSPQEFLAQALPHLKAAAERGEIGWSTMALMIDRDLVHRGQPQIYGTQGKLVDGHFVLDSVQDEAHLDERRASIGMGPIADYKLLIEKDYQPQAGAR